MKRYSTSLVIREMQIKSRVIYHFIHIRMVIIKKTITNVGKEMEKLELSYIAYWNVKWYSCFGIQSGTSLNGY